MKVLFWDVETSSMDLMIRTYQLKNYTSYFDPKLIERDWTMLGASWAYDDEEPRVISVSTRNPLDDRKVVERLHKVLGKADALVGHNSDAFDLKKFNTRAVFYGLDPLAKKIRLDTLKMARKYFKFSSNKLSYICNYLGLEAKDESPDWDKCLEGDAQELRYMRQYNKQDVVATRELYYKLRGWHDTHPRMQDKVRDIEGREVEVCKVCGSPELKKDGTRLVASGRRKQKFQCLSCGSYQIGGFIN